MRRLFLCVCNMPGDPIEHPFDDSDSNNLPLITLDQSLNVDISFKLKHASRQQNIREPTGLEHK